MLQNARAVRMRVGMSLGTWYWQQLSRKGEKGGIEGIQGRKELE